MLKKRFGFEVEPCVCVCVCIINMKTTHTRLMLPT